MTKICCACNQTKTLDCFSPNGKGRCKECQKIYLDARALLPKKVTPEKKNCFTCGLEKPIAEFCRNRRKIDGYDGRCRPCHKEASKKRQTKIADHLATNPELPTEKECYRCKKTKSMSDYCISKNRFDGRHTECKACTNERDDERTAKRQKSRAKSPPILPENKICTRCGVKKLVEDFGKSERMVDGIHGWCAECVRKSNAEYRGRKTDIVLDAKLQQGNSCAQCKVIFDPDDLEFAHHNRYEKARNKEGRSISVGSLALDLLQKELAKGHFLCKRCHLKNTILEDQERLAKNPFQKAAHEQRLAPLNEFIRQDKLARGKCAKCEEEVQDIPWVLRYFEYDHIDPQTKLFSISRGILSGRTESELKHELTKCQLLCNSCHRKKTKTFNDLIRGRTRSKPDTIEQPNQVQIVETLTPSTESQEPLKTCSTCKESFTFDKFSQNVSSPDGRERRCKKCMAKAETDYVARKRSQMALTVKTCLMCKEEKPMNDYAPLAHDIRFTTSYCGPCNAKLKATREKNKQEKSEAALRTTLECSKCKQELTKDKFDLNLRSNKGHAAKCRDCVAFYELRKNESDEICRRRAANEPLDNLTKTCAGCKEAKPLTSFCADKSRDGFLVYCRECHHENYKRTRDNLKNKQNAKRQKVSTTTSTTTSVNSYTKLN